MTKQLYVVRNHHGDVVAEGVTAQRAAEEILTYDSCKFRVALASDDRGRLTGFRRIEITKPHGNEFFFLFGVHSNRNDALWDKVIASADAWGGCTAVTVEEYAAEMAEIDD